jgi:hypothetical protein
MADAIPAGADSSRCVIPWPRDLAAANHDDVTSPCF